LFLSFLITIDRLHLFSTIALVHIIWYGNDILVFLKTKNGSFQYHIMPTLISQDDEQKGNNHGNCVIVKRILLFPKRKYETIDAYRLMLCMHIVEGGVVNEEIFLQSWSFCGMMLIIV